MDVAVFDCDEYTLTISTASIDNAWQRFSRRVKDDALTYCDYSSSREGKLSLHCPFDENSYEPQPLSPEVPQTEWKEKHPVLFETCKYQFAIEFKNLESTQNERRNPKVHHALKSVGEAFRFYKSGSHSGILVGEIDFLNSPGKFKFTFDYIDEEGVPCRDFFEAYVASPKLDTKNDLHEITELINEEYENYVFDHLTLTFSSYTLTRAERNNSIVWLSIFKNAVDDYFNNIAYIMSRPNNRSVRRVYYRHPEKIRRWSPQQEERYRDYGADADKHWFRCEQTENTTNTRENRFVKYSLRVLGKKFHEVFGEVGSLYYKDMDAEEIKLLESYDKKFKKFLAAPFFKKMHRYRDAIYYSMKDDKRPRGKEVIGGYILFPGRAEGKKIEDRYFYKSIKEVNIGAFPLLPADKEHKEDLVRCNLLERHLREILLEDSIIEHVKDSIPQKGLAYTYAPEDRDSVVIVGYCRTPLQWEKTTENKLYYVREGIKGTLPLSPGYEYCKYLLMYRGDKKEMFQLVGKGPRIMTRTELQTKGFDPSGEIYLVYDLEDSKPVTTFHGKTLEIKKDFKPRPAATYFTTLKELLEDKEEQE